MVQFNFTYDPNISLEQRVGFELAAMIWSTYLTDNVAVNFHIASSDSLGDGGAAVGGAIPLFHEQNYGVYQEYLAIDATSENDKLAIDSLQAGNTTDFLIDGQIVDGNSDILLTSAQAKALGMDEALVLGEGENEATWDRNLIDANKLDGYIIISNAFDWNYDYTRSGTAPEGTLDFMSMALHEIGHQLGFVSSLDGTLDLTKLYSGETQAANFTALDLFRNSADSNEIDNPDGAVSDLSLGQNSFFSIDGGQTNLGDFADGVEFQASHWKRLKVAMGIMDPTLAYKERLSLGYLDLQAMDVLGWDINYGALKTGLDLDTLLLLAENKVEASLGLGETALDANRGGGKHGDMYKLGYSQWWSIFEKHILELGYSQWWSIFELGYSQWWQQHEEDTLELGYSQWWQSFEDTILDLGYSQWWQSFESDMLNLGYSQWWQLLELGYSQWWQQLDTFFSTLDKVDGNASKEKSKEADGGVAGKDAKVYRGGKEDDIIAGNKKQDRIKAGDGDDLVDGKGGHDVIWGEAGNDIIYGQDGNDLIYGGDDDDLLLGEAGDDELHGEDGHDIVSGGSGDDIVTGGEGRDDLKGGWGNDVLDGGEGDDRLEGEADSDILIGGEGRDQLNGGGGDDVIYGDAYEGTESLAQLRKQLQAQAKASGESPTDTDVAPTNASYNPIRVEAESMTLTGGAYIHTAWNNDSGDSVKTSGSSTATTTFSGQSGSYMVVVRYFDEIGGNGQLDFGLNGTALNSFDLNQETDHYYTRTVAQNLTLNTGDKFTITATADGADDAAFDYVEFIPLGNLIETSLDQPLSSGTSNDSSNTSILGSVLGLFSLGSTTSGSTAAPQSALRVEAESMTLVGDYYRESNNSASGGSLIAVSNQGQGKALTGFSGEAGYYNIVVGYYDESDEGIAQISAALNNVELDSWSLDQSFGNVLANAQTFTTRMVASTVFLQDGDIFELTGLRGGGLSSDELARIDYVDFVKVDLAQQDSSTDVAANEPVVVGEAIRIEAELMQLNGYSKESSSNSSGGKVIRTSTKGTAATKFSGEAGYYNVVVAYYDENDGVATLSASLRGVELDSWQLNQDLGSNIISSNNSNRVTRTIATQIQVNTGDELMLRGAYQQGEFARIDYVEFVPVSAPAAAIKTNNDDFLQGGEGNDTLYGGEGNDILYGESAGDNASSTLKGSQTYNGHTYLLSGAASWEDAQLQAKQLGGNLVTLNDAAEEAWIRDTFSATERLWTGINDIAVEGQFEWVSGEAVTYTNWAPGEPNNYGGNQDTGTINYNNQWDDAASWSYLRGVIEINKTNNDILVGGNGDDILYGNGGDDVMYGDDKTDIATHLYTYNGHTYLFSEVGTWYEAQAEAERLGGDLLTLNNAAEETWVRSTFSASERLWTGINDIAVEGKFEWVSGETVTYTNWAPGEPNNAGGSQDYGTINFNQQWDDSENHGSYEWNGQEWIWLEGLRGVIEIKGVFDGGNDTIYGGVGNDTIYGGAGNDVLDGSDAIAAGYLEQDTLIGGGGADIFILGSASQSYYLGAGNRDYAVIKDFDASEDKVVLHGVAGSYTQQKRGNDIHLSYQGSSSDLVAIFENVESLNLGTGFVFA